MSDTLVDYKPGLSIPGLVFPGDDAVSVVDDVEAILQSLGEEVICGTLVNGGPCVFQSASEQDASATFVILTNQLNRHGNKHRIAQSKQGRGLLADMWSRAPIVYLEHMQNRHWTLPIGLAEKDQKVHLRMNQSQVQSTVFFDQSHAVPMDIFRMVNAGIMRMASIGTDPIKAVPLHNQATVTQSGYRGWEFVETQMAEWSVCASGVDPGAVRQCISDGKVGGEKIHQTTRMIIEPFAEAKPAQGVGFDFSRLDNICERLERVIQSTEQPPADPPAVAEPPPVATPVVEPEPVAEPAPEPTEQTATLTAPAPQPAPQEPVVTTTIDTRTLVEAIKESFAPIQEGVQNLHRRIDEAIPKK